MTVVYEQPDVLVVRFDRGEAVMDELVRFCQERAIQGAYLTAIGAASEVELAWYDPERQEYETKTYQGLWEIASAIGNVAMANGDVVLHLHGVFSTPDQTVAGHIMSMTVGGVCEVMVRPLSGGLQRELDPAIGLKVLQSSE